MRVVFTLLCALIASAAFAQAPAAAAPPVAPATPTRSATSAASQAGPVMTVAAILDRRLTTLEKQFVDLADAMPESKYNFVPTQGEFKGVRTFAEQVRHVAATNYLVFSALLGEKPPDVAEGESGPTNLKTKAEIMKYLRDSFALGHRAMQTLTPDKVTAVIPSPFGQGQANPLAMAVMVYGHCYDHYGQLVEYLRMNNIVPPASRQQN